MVKALDGNVLFQFTIPCEVNAASGALAELALGAVAAPLPELRCGRLFSFDRADERDRARGLGFCGDGREQPAKSFVISADVLELSNFLHLCDELAHRGRTIFDRARGESTVQSDELLHELLVFGQRLSAHDAFEHLGVR